MHWAHRWAWAQSPRCQYLPSSALYLWLADGAREGSIKKWMKESTGDFFSLPEPSFLFCKWGSWPTGWTVKFPLSPLKLWFFPLLPNLIPGSWGHSSILGPAELEGKISHGALDQQPWQLCGRGSRAGNKMTGCVQLFGGQGSDLTEPMQIGQHPRLGHPRD